MMNHDGTGPLPQCYLKAGTATPYTNAGRYSCAPKSERRATLADAKATGRLSQAMPPATDQVFTVVKNKDAADGSVTIQQAGLCIDNNFKDTSSP